MKLTLWILWFFSLAVTYEFAFKNGVENEMFNSFVSGQKARNCLEVLSGR